MADPTSHERVFHVRALATMCLRAVTPYISRNLPPFLSQYEGRQRALADALCGALVSGDLLHRNRHVRRGRRQLLARH